MAAFPSLNLILSLLPLVAAVKNCYPGCHCVVESYGLFSSFSLTKVDCSGVKLGTGPLPIPLDTAYLDLSSGSLHAVQGSMLRGPGYTTLVGLDLSHNGISEVEHGAFAQLRYLESLDLSHNGLGELEEGWLTRLPLADVDLSHNRLRELHLGALATGAHGRPVNVDISDNLLTTVTRDLRAAPPNLQTLSLARNRLTSVPSLHGVPLRYLNLDGNPISAISRGSFSGLTDLVHLSLAGLSALSVLHPRSFEDLRSLQVLDLSNNTRLGSLDPEVLVDLVSLQELNLSNSGVTTSPEEILKHLPSLRTLILSGVRCHRTQRLGSFHQHMGRGEMLTCDSMGVVL
ncbi:tsukushi-like [Brienomyrus brachyistius]|uniref:tsukushi-like n=1 Tax=Brienomyrus brachyistius TaxID=42636 RepID=UPI0020B3EDBF|nr:tsukushi-like [Brienomyrus brachyistius]XP_048853714.1 tsukushi-like [Brienomyrus brachyistius]